MTDELEAEAYLQQPSVVELTARLRQAMVPVEPSAAFVRSLGRELVAASRRTRRLSPGVRRGILIGAAALGSVASVAGVLTVVLLRRRSHLGRSVAG